MLTSDDQPARRIRWVQTDNTPPTVIPSATDARPAVPRPTSLHPTDADPVEILRLFTASHESRSALHADLRAAVDEAERQRRQAQQFTRASEAAAVAHRTEQAKDPKRRAALVRQCLLAILMLLLEVGPCYLAAQALGEDVATTSVVTFLFVVSLAGGEFGLDWAQRQDAPRTWRRVALGLGLFVGALGALRLYFLTVTGSSLVDAVLGAGLLTAATGVFVVTGYLALRVAETLAVWRLRRAAQAAAKTASAAQEEARQALAARDRLLGALMREVQPALIERLRGQAAVRTMEVAMRNHLVAHTLQPETSGR